MPPVSGDAPGLGELLVTLHRSILCPELLSHGNAGWDHTTVAIREKVGGVSAGFCVPSLRDRRVSKEKIKSSKREQNVQLRGSIGKCPLCAL